MQKDNPANRVASRRFWGSVAEGDGNTLLSKVQKVFRANFWKRAGCVFGVAVALWLDADAFLIGRLCLGRSLAVVILGGVQGVSGLPLPALLLLLGLQ